MIDCRDTDQFPTSLYLTLVFTSRAAEHLSASYCPCTQVLPGEFLKSLCFSWAISIPSLIVGQLCSPRPVSNHIITPQRSKRQKRTIIDKYVNDREAANGDKAKPEAFKTKYDSDINPNYFGIGMTQRSLTHCR